MDFNILYDSLKKQEIEDAQYYGSYDEIKDVDDLHDRLLNIKYNTKTIQYDTDLYDEMCRLLPFFHIEKLNDEILEELYG